jgi:multisubunit Na+/H+ antiporter MnhB subunit
MTILNTITVDIVTGKAHYFSWSIGCWVGIIFTIACVIAFALSIIEAIKEKDILMVLLGILVLGLGAAILFGAVLPHDVTATVNQYEVTINEDITFKEVMDKYNFIEQRGDIYVLREKLLEGVTELKNDR